MIRRFPRLVVFALLLFSVVTLAAQTPVPPPPPPFGPVRVGGDIREPRKIVNVPPVYPPEAKAAGIQGVVILEAVINTEGKVQNVRVLRGVPMLTEPAIAAVSQWEYTPTSLNGMPVAVIMTVTVNFSLAGGSTGMPAAAPIDVTGEWMGDDGGRYQVRTIGSELFWFGSNAAESWWHVFHGQRTLTGDYAGRWADLPPGRGGESGSLTVRIISPEEIEIVGNQTNFPGRRLRRVSAAAGRTLLN